MTIISKLIHEKIPCHSFLSYLNPKELSCMDQLNTTSHKLIKDNDTHYIKTFYNILPRLESQSAHDVKPVRYSLFISCINWISLRIHRLTFQQYNKIEQLAKRASIVTVIFNWALHPFGRQLFFMARCVPNPYSANKINYITGAFLYYNRLLHSLLSPHTNKTKEQLAYTRTLVVNFRLNLPQFHHDLMHVNQFPFRVITTSGIDPAYVQLHFSNLLNDYMHRLDQSPSNTQLIRAEMLLSLLYIFHSCLSKYCFVENTIHRNVCEMVQSLLIYIVNQNEIALEMKDFVPNLIEAVKLTMGLNIIRDEFYYTQWKTNMLDKLSEERERLVQRGVFTEDSINSMQMNIKSIYSTCLSNPLRLVDEVLGCRSNTNYCRISFIACLTQSEYLALKLTNHDHNGRLLVKQSLSTRRKNTITETNLTEPRKFVRARRKNNNNNT
jgi:hypothetical protein